MHSCTSIIIYFIYLHNHQVAFKGGDFTVQEEVAKVIKDFHGAGKPMGFCCSAPVLPAGVLGVSSLSRLNYLNLMPKDDYA